jgi:hypothetical protein
VARLPAAWRDVRASMRSAGGLRPPPAAPCSLLAPTGPHRTFAVAHADLDQVRRTAHAAGGTVGDALLVAHASALARLLERRGERVPELRVALPMAVRPQARDPRPGNRVVPLLVGVATSGSVAERIAGTGSATRAARSVAGGRAPIAVLAPAVRLAAATGAYRWYLRRQRRMHTLVSNVRGPAAPVSFAGAPVTAMIPLSVGEAGNLTVTAVALSYAGALTVTLVADADRVPDLRRVATDVAAALGRSAG